MFSHAPALAIRENPDAPAQQTAKTPAIRSLRRALRGEPAGGAEFGVKGRL